MTETRNCPECGAELPPDSPSGLCPRCLLKQGFESHAADKLAETAAPATRFTAPSPADLARHFPQLEVLELLGQGGMGAVYKARQATLDRLVAIKILPAEVGRDPAFAERFTREARALARLSHPNIVGIYDFGQVDGLYYFIMEYVDGVSLRQLVEQHQLSPGQALALVPQICEALQFAHDEGIVHRDVKPENILLDKRGRVKIADFGLAKLLGRAGDQVTLTRIEQVMGTPLYMAPEQMRGSHAVDHRADIYSLGVVFYEMLTGELPVGRFAPPSHKVQVDVRLDEVVLRTLEREPDRRYQHASDVKSEVESIVASPAPAAAVTADGAVIPTPTPCPARVRAPAIGLLITGIFNWVWTLTVGSGFAYLWATSPRSESWHLEGGLLALAAVAILATSTIVMLAALKMMRCEAYGLSMIGTVLAMLVSPGNVIGLPIGIWALVVLLRRDVKAAFPHPRKSRHDVKHGGSQTATSAAIVYSGGGRPKAGADEHAAEFTDRPATVGTTSTPQSAEASDEDLVVRALRRTKNKNQAIRLYRDLTGTGLAAAKTAVEALANKHGIEFNSLTQRKRALQIAAASLVLIAAAYFITDVALSEHVKVVILIGGSALYVAFLVAHGIGAREDRLRNRRLAGGDAGQTPPLAAFFACLLRSRRALRALQCLLSLVAVACFLVFFSFRSEGHHDSQGHWQSSWAVGSPMPWFVYETWPATNTPFRWNFMLSSSWLIALLAFAICYATWRIEKVLHPQAGFWSGSPHMVLLGWWLVVMFITGYTIWVGNRSLGWSIPPGQVRSVNERVGSAPAVRLTASPTDDRPTVNSKTPSSSPLLAAAERGQIGEIKKLLSDGADINDKDANGETALMTAAIHDHVSLVQTLLSLGASETERDRAGETALMKAAAQGHVECVRAMLNGHAGPVALRDKQGRTALAQAVLNRRTGFLRAMTEISNAGVGVQEANYPTNTLLDPRDVPWMNDEGKTIVDEARERGFDEIADLLRQYVEKRIELDTKYLGIAKDGHWNFYLHRGRCFEALGERAKADADFQECRRLLDQDFPGYRPEGLPP